MWKRTDKGVKRFLTSKHKGTLKQRGPDWPTVWKRTTTYAMPRLAAAPVTSLGSALESIATLGAGRRAYLDQAALAALAYGHRVAFLELWCGSMHLTLGVRAAGLLVPDGMDRLFPMGSRVWDFALEKDRADAEELVDYLDPMVLHGAPPCEKLSQMCLKPDQPGYDAEASDSAVAAVAWYVRLVRKRVRKRRAGSMESPKGASTWSLKDVVEFFGVAKSPERGAYFAEPHFCAYGMQEPGDPTKFWKKAVVLAATYPEILEVDDKCPGDHEHQEVRGSVKLPGGHWVGRGKLSASYPLAACVAWGRAIARACQRISLATGEEWVRSQVLAAGQLPRVVKGPVQSEGRICASACPRVPSARRADRCQSWHGGFACAVRRTCATSVRGIRGIVGG